MANNSAPSWTLLWLASSCSDALCCECNRCNADIFCIVQPCPDEVKRRRPSEEDTAGSAPRKFYHPSYWFSSKCCGRGDGGEQLQMAGLRMDPHKSRSKRKRPQKAVAHAKGGDVAGQLRAYCSQHLLGHAFLQAWDLLLIC